MSRDRYAVSYQSGGSRPLMGRVFVGLLVLVAIVFVLLSRAQHPLMGKIRAGALDIFTPMVEFVSTPVRGGIRNMVRDKDMLFGAYEENKKLRTELEGLRRWQETAAALKAENDALRSLSNYSPVEEARYITARVTGQSPSGYSARITLNAGSSDGVALQPVIDAYGLIGRISEVGEHTSQVLLLSDSLSRVPVITARTRTHAILAGTGLGDALMRMTFLGQENASITVGESVVTTEEGGLIPGGIGIGAVFKRDSDGYAVQPCAPLAQSEYVRIVVVKQHEAAKEEPKAEAKAETKPAEQAPPASPVH